MIKTNNAKIFMVIPVKGGKMIIQRYGLVYRVLLDCPEGVVEFDQHWIKRHRRRLDLVTENGMLATEKHGREVLTYG